MARDIGPKIGIDGEAQYRKEIQGIIQQAKTLDAEMRAVASSFDKEGESQKKNLKTTEEYTKAIDAHKKKIAALEEAVRKSAEATGENSVETNKWKEILANAKTELNGLEGGLEDTAKKTSIFGEALKAALSKEVIMGGIKAIKDGMVAIGKAAYSFGKEVITAYADFEQLEGGVEKLYGKDAMKVVQNAQVAFKTAGMSANEYMETVTNFSASLVSSLGGDTAQAAELADRAIRDMSDNANTFGTDMQSIQNAYQGFAKGQYTMLDNLKLGYGGTKTEMERLITDAEKLDKNFRAQRTANGDLAMSFDDIIKAIGIVQTDLKITGTTAREASKTISGSVDSLKSAFQNLVIGLGSENADIDKLLWNVVESFQNVVANVQPIIQRLIDYIPGIVGAILPVLQSMAPQLVATAAELFNGFVSAVVSVLPDLIPVAIDAVELLGSTLIDNLPTLVEAGVELIVGLMTGFADALPALIEQAPMIISTLANAIINNLPAIAAAGIKIIQSLINGIISMAGSLPEIIYNVLVNIKNSFSGGIDAAKTWGSDLITNFANGIVENAKQVWENVREVAQGIWDLLHFSEPEKGPLKNFSTYAPDMMKTFAKGITQNQHLVTDAAAQAMEGVSGAMTMTGGNAYNYGGFNISVYQQPGESTDALVDRIMYAMQSRVDQKKAVFA